MDRVQDYKHEAWGLIPSFTYTEAELFFGLSCTLEKKNTYFKIKSNSK